MGAGGGDGKLGAKEGNVLSSTPQGGRGPQRGRVGSGGGLGGGIGQKQRQEPAISYHSLPCVLDARNPEQLFHASMSFFLLFAFLGMSFSHFLPC